MRGLYSFILALALLTPGAALANHEQNPLALSAPLIAEIRNLAALIDQMTIEMGSTAVPIAQVEAHETSLRDLYSIAMSAFAKGRELKYEWTRDLATMPDEIRNPDEAAVADLLRKSRGLIEEVAAHIGFPLDPPPPPLATALSANEALEAMLGINRRLNNILRYRLDPTDVYSKVSHAVAYTSNLLALFPDAERIPAEEPTPRQKKPGDVHTRLRTCLAILNEIDKKSGYSPLVIESFEMSAGLTILPGDVYDMATLVVDELDHLYVNKRLPPPPRLIYYGASKLPSHVYRRVGLLEAQLKILKKQVDQTPGWLQASGHE